MFNSLIASELKKKALKKESPRFVKKRPGGCWDKKEEEEEEEGDENEVG